MICECYKIKEFQYFAITQIITLYNMQGYTPYLQNLLSNNKIYFLTEEQYQQQNSKKDLQINMSSKEQIKFLPQTNIKENLKGQLIQRYCRQMLLKEIVYQGQLKIVQKSVAIIGAGGIGCPLAIYLAGAGVGRIGLFDSDVVDVTNLHRQIGHKNDSVGLKKTASLKNSILQFNPNIQVTQHQFITVQTVQQLQKYDLVIDGSDNPACRYIVNDYCMKINKKLLSGACIGWQGQITCYGDQSPCYRCLWGDQQKTSGGCSTLGVVGMIPGFVGIILALQALKLIIHNKSSLEGFLLTYESKTCTFRKMKLRNKVKQCIACGQKKLEMKLYNYEKHAVCKVNLNDIPNVPQKNWPDIIKQGNIKDYILDVRPSNQYDIAHLEKTVSIPYTELIKKSGQQIQKLSQQYFKNQASIKVCCTRGINSKKAVEYLTKLNFKAVSLRGGMNAYSKEIDPKVPRF